MKFRLDSQHYMHDRLLEVGQMVGDTEDCIVQLTTSDGEKAKPSVWMTPMDDEAKRWYKECFPDAKLPERDPTKAIPLRGTGDTAKAPGEMKPPSAPPAKDK